MFNFFSRSSIFLHSVVSPWVVPSCEALCRLIKCQLAFLLGKRKWSLQSRSAEFQLLVLNEKLTKIILTLYPRSSRHYR